MPITTGRPCAAATFVAEDIECWDCANRLKLALECYPGVEAATVDGDTGAVTVSFREGDLDLDELTRAIRESGYRVDVIVVRSSARQLASGDGRLS